MLLPHVSFSALAAWSRCGEAYRRERILGEKEAGSLPTVVGSAFHKAAELWEGLPPTSISLQDRIKMLVDYTTSYVLEVDGVRGLRHYGKQNLDWWLSTGIVEMSRKYAEFREQEQANGFGWLHGQFNESIEIELRVQLADDLPPIRGYVDQVHYDANGLLVLRDLKTGSPRPEHNIQGNIYAVAWNLLHPDDPCDYVSDLYLKGKQAELHTTVPSMTVESLAAMVREYVRAVAADIFPYSGPFTDACRPCSFQKDCPAGVAVAGSNILL